MLLVINSLGGGHTHTHTHTNTHTRILSRTEAILRNQARAGLRLTCAWFKNIDGLTALQNLLADKTSEDWS